MADRTLREIVVVPPVPALLPEHASLVDPVAELRAAVAAATAGLRAAGGLVGVLGSPAAAHVADHLLDGVPHAPYDAERPPADLAGLLVLGNGSATRTEKAPGHLDERAEAFDVALGAALAAGDGATLAAVDADLGRALWAEVDALRTLGGLLRDGGGAWQVEVTYDDAPYGVQYWVARLTR
ncbi:hypothetical protein QE364_002765 [Nocardioides zeae]|uniref:Uncharacterized protein n=2 Tax=Nocardioides zeae TaxID=1457234 RepID=A0ACC6IK14_9ACTN|nr:hypothetical protein [Nocardioides zeae]MDQ1106695.1 hypothetical protein [Nocardioides zeae]MDR6173640.1 hypothetical protein [Nocardioides zeae]MDR6211046.1 hypothetical protein [Nocardioides zeae]